MQKYSMAAAASLALLGLYMASLYNYLLFHSVAEGFAIVIAFGIFMVAWNTRSFTANNYIVLLGIAYLHIGILDTAHTLSYSGMNIFAGYGANLPTQLWIAARYMEGLTLFGASILGHRRINTRLLMSVYSAVTIGVLLTTFHWQVFPDSFLREAGGLTPFKKTSEYIISLMLLASGGVFLLRRSHFDASFIKLVLPAIVITVLSELAFTTYASVFGFSNLIGHFLKIISYWLIYRAVIVAGLTRPHDLLFRELNRQKEWLRVTLASIGDAVVATDMKGNIVFLNRVAKELTGWAGDEALGRPVTTVFRIVHEHTRKVMRDPVSQVLKTGAAATLAPHTVLVRKNGTDLPIDDSAAPIRDREGNIVGGVLIFRDVSERVDAEKALQHLNDTLEQRVIERTELAESRSERLRDLAVELINAEERERRRIAQLLHDDLQQVLASAKLQLESAARDLPALPALAKIERMLKESIAKSRRLSHELSPPVLSHGSFFDAMQWLASQMEDQFGLKARLEAESSGDFHNDPLKLFLFRAVQEFLFNIVKHAKVSQAHISLFDTSESFVVSVSDKGTGFDPEKIESSSIETGLGLASLKERSAYMGVDLQIKSVPGKGSRFTLTVPHSLVRLNEPQAPEPKLPSPGPVLDAKQASDKERGPRVIFADDHEVMRQALVSMMAGRPDIQVVGEAANGREAIEMTRSLRPNVVVMDISMPVMDGIEATRRIKKEFPEIRVIGLSMYKDEQIARRVGLAGADAFLNKTASSSDLLSAIYGGPVPA
jgi:PAS domain S-box-containing protein